MLAHEDATYARIFVANSLLLDKVLSVPYKVYVSFIWTFEALLTSQVQIAGLFLLKFNIFLLLFYYSASRYVRKSNNIFYFIYIFEAPITLIQYSTKNKSIECHKL